MANNMKKPIGVICAMESELNDLLQNLEDRRDITHYGYTFYEGHFSGTPAVLVQCGIGKVNAARGTQMLLDYFEPQCVVNSGIAGGTAPGLSVGDVVIGTDLVQHDFDATGCGYVVGYMFTGEDGNKPTLYTADPKLVDALEASARKAAPERGIHRGRIATVDQFISSTEQKQRILSLFNATCAEMESGAIAQTCQCASVPFGILRVVSDLADGSASESFETFEKETADLSAAILLNFLHGVGQDA